MEFLNLPFLPAYLKLPVGELDRRAAQAYGRLAQCDLCARTCKVDRIKGKAGVCRTGLRARVSSYGPHLGEEAPLSGWRGSGTIFFAGCNLRCQFCQNHAISQTDAGQETSPEELAAIMLELQARGCHNINLVSPSHIIPQILAAVAVAACAGLHLPLFYNTGGFDAVEALALLDGVVDIYMPDLKYAEHNPAHRYSRASSYPAVARAAVKEMYRQVGDLMLDSRGLATRGLLVRHLLLPGGLSGVEDVVRFLVQEISPDTYLNLVDQYYPAYHASRFPELNRRLTAGEYEQALRFARDLGLHRLDIPVHTLDRFWAAQGRVSQYPGC